MKQKIIIYSIIAFCSFILFLFIEYIHFNFFNVNLLGKAVAFDAFLAIIITSVISLKLRKIYNLFEIFLLNLSLLMILLYIGLLGPTVIDRSLTFYTIDKIATYENGFRKDKLFSLFQNDYLKEYQVDKIRFTEINDLELINEVGGCLVITKKGKFIVKFGRFYRNNFLPKKRLLDGEYLDFKPSAKEATTDPQVTDLQTDDLQRNVSEITNIPIDEYQC